MDDTFPPSLSGGGFDLRPLEEADRGALAAAASDPLIWELHPASDRWRPEVFAPYFDYLMAQGGTLVVEKDGRIVGCSRFYFAPEISIGFTFLERALWGGAANRIIKDLMIGHALKTAPAVWFHIGPDNLRSQAATAKLGAVVVRRETLDLGTGMAEYLTLRLSAEDWHAARPL